MVRLAIRDDDLNFFSSYEDVERVYAPIKDIPISFAIIPAVMDCNPEGLCAETKVNKTPEYIGNNKELIEWLKVGLEDHKLDVLMHGITHEYRFKDDIKIPEMIWRNESDFVSVIGKMKEKIEKILDYKITVFVAPSNKISK